MIKVTLKVLGQKFEGEVEKGTSYSQAIEILEQQARASSTRNANISFSGMDLFHAGKGKVKDQYEAISGDNVELSAIKAKHESA